MHRQSRRGLWLPSMDHKHAVMGSQQQLPMVSSTNSGSKSRGVLLGAKVVGGLGNSIAGFAHLAACRSTKCGPIQRNYRDMVSVLRALKPVLDEIVDYKICFDVSLVREFEGLDITVNEAKDLLERWSPKMSKIYIVLRSAYLLANVRRSLFEICNILSKLQQQQLSFFLTESKCLEHCLQELKCIDQDERISDLLEEALRGLSNNILPKTSHLLKMMELLGLKSNQELLLENIALERGRLRAEVQNNIEEMENIGQIIDLISHISDYIASTQYKEIHGIAVPSHFQCPLSLELMVDPVIVASGQTYERSFIQQWIDQGLRTCPRSHQILSHTNMIPNYTVTALIASWREANNMRFFDNIGSCDALSATQKPRHELSQVDGSVDSSYKHRTVISPSSINARDKLDLERVANPLVVEEVVNLVEVVEFLKTSNHEVINGVSSKWEIHDKCYGHSRSKSVTSVISSLDDVVLRETNGCDQIEVPKFVLPECRSSPSTKDLALSSWLPSVSSNGKVIRNGIRTHHRSCSSVSDSTYDDLTIYSIVQKLVEDLRSQSNDAQTAAAAEIRLLTRHNMENRILIAKCGAIKLLIPLLYSSFTATQENAVTALLNLSINDNNKVGIAEAGAIEPLVHVLKAGTPEAKENSAATLFSLSALEEFKIKIGRSAAVKALVDLLGSGTLRGKKDAATALFNLSIIHENKARIVQAGAVKHLIYLIKHSEEMVDKSVALLANLATIPEGMIAVTREGGIPLLVEVLEYGSPRGKENSASALLQLCLSSQKFCTLVLQEGAVPPLVALCQSGTPRAKEKAQVLLSHFRIQREVNNGKAKS